MAKAIAGMVMVLSLTGMVMGQSAAFDLSNVEVNTGGGATLPADTQVAMNLFVNGSTTVDAMSLAMETLAPIQFISIDGIGAGKYFQPSNDGGATWNDGAQIMGYDVFNPGNALPALAANTLMATITLKVPAGTPVGNYTVSTVVSAYGDFASGLSNSGTSVAMTQDIGTISVIVPEPATALLGLLGLPLLRRRKA